MIHLRQVLLLKRVDDCLRMLSHDKRDVQKKFKGDARHKKLPERLTQRFQKYDIVRPRHQR